MNCTLRAFAVIGTLLSCSIALADSHLVLIGGGPTPEDSQVSIEENMRWLNEVFASGFASRSFFFGTGGRSPTEVKIQTTAPADEDFEALATVFGQSWGARFRYRPTVLDVDHPPLTAERWKEVLAEEMAALGPGDDFLLVYNGHGDYDPNPTKNWLRVWEETAVTVTEIDAILRDAPAESQLRFVWPQCFSGAFNRLAFRDLEPARGLRTGARVCAFASVSEDSPAEGCITDPDEGDYRDYSTFFFAALDGETRDGRPLAANPDSDGDGRVSLHEAHLYAISHGISGDIPRATSEAYLLAWKPWYLRWLSFDGAAEDNDYYRAARALSADFESRFRTRAYFQALRQRVAAAEVELQREVAQWEALLDEAESVRRALQETLTLRWPTLGRPHTAAYHETVRDELRAVDSWVRAQPAFAELRRLEAEVASSDERVVAARRERARIHRLQRLLMLGRLHDRLVRYGDDKEKTEYLELLACESWVPPLNAKTNPP